MGRVKISASYNFFISELDKLIRFDFDNQKKFSSGELNREQIEFLAESIFFSGFRSFEGFIREVFILYCMEKASSKKGVKSYLKPKSIKHTEQLLKSSMPFVDWTSPDIVIERAELFLRDGYPIKLSYTTNLQKLRDFKRLRNHIAHYSEESKMGYEKVIQAHNNGTLPLKIPTLGNFLMQSSKTNSNSYNLLDFFQLLKAIAKDIT